MKKLIYGGLALILALSFAACGNLGQTGDDTQVVKVVTDRNGNTTVTIPLEGDGVPTRSVNRALSKQMAQAGYDFLEVVFYAHTATGPDVYNTARASWEIGSAMTIKGVPRGIDYDSNNPTGLAVNKGAATLFVGKKVEQGYVLLAVGKITKVDAATSSNVLAASKTVTFGLAAFTGNTAVSGTSSFAFTAGAHGTTPATYTTVQGIPVRSHNMIATATGKIGSYTLGVSAGAIADYLPGIRTVDTTGTVTFRDPWLYTAANGKIEIAVPNVKIIDDGVAPTFTGLTADGALTNPIVINFTTTAELGVISFYFYIPVYAVTTSTTNTLAGITVPAATTWVIMPGTDAPYLDGGVGASILIASGVPTFTVDDNDITVIATY